MLRSQNKPSPPGHMKRRLLSSSGTATGAASPPPPPLNNNSPEDTKKNDDVSNEKENKGHSSSRRASRSISKVLGGATAASTARPRKKTLFSAVVGGVFGVYFLLTFALQPVVDVESINHQRGASHPLMISKHGGGGDGNHHSPMMLLREREIARRKIKEDSERAGKVNPQQQQQQDGGGGDGGGDDDDDPDKNDSSEEIVEVDEDDANKGKEEGDDDDDAEGGKDKEDVAVGIQSPVDDNKDSDASDEELQQKVEDIKAVREAIDEKQKQQAKKKKEDGEKTDTKKEEEKDGKKKKKKKAKAPPKPTPKPRILPVVPRNAREAPMEGDPLRATDWPFESKPIDIKPAVEYLGTLLDAGRHYFPIEWIKKMIDRLADMNYNLIHFRLTDDQTFNVLLKSRPQLAYPTAVNNPDKRVYTPKELREITAYAKKRGIRIMPEINVPGHGGAWAGIKDLVVPCPRFICDKGYGLPINVTHHDIKPILTDIIKEIVDIFDDPPFLHLGGDEVNMAGPCFREVSSPVFDYPAFEMVLKKIIKASGYPEDRVVRWEMTGQKALTRAGAIEQFWESHPGDRHDATGKFFVSTWMYFDTNGDQDAYEVYTKADKSFHLKRGVMPTAIIAGTFELSCEFWYDRNILGRLLSVAIGAAHQNIPGKNAQTHVMKQWKDYCDQLGFGDIICDTEGRPVIATRSYHNKWSQGWTVWKKDICDRLTETKGVRSYQVSPQAELTYYQESNRYFWNNFPLELAEKDEDDDEKEEEQDEDEDEEKEEVVVEEEEEISANKLDPSQLPRDVKRLFKHRIPHTGVILDVASAMPKVGRLHSIINDYVAFMGFNLAQLRLIDNHGFVYESNSLEGLGNSLIAGKDNPLYSLKPELKKLVASAHTAGVELMPEVSVSTDAGGWFRTGFLANCPELYCTGKGTPTNINNANFFPVLFSIIGELRQVFSTSRFFHLGADEREASMECFKEADIRPKFDIFEKKLETLMALANLAPDEIIRTENMEGVYYQDRAGSVTQYRARTTFDDVQENMMKDEQIFLTIDLFKGNGYDIFETAKKAVALNPLGILAEIRKLNVSKWKSWSIPKRLLAFAMGVSEIGSFWSIYSEETFEKYYVSTCEALELDEDGDCSPPEDFQQPITVITDSKEFVDKSCEVHTRVQDKHVARKVKPFYKHGKLKLTAQE